MDRWPASSFWRTSRSRRDTKSRRPPTRITPPRTSPGAPAGETRTIGDAAADHRQDDGDRGDAPSLRRHRIFGKHREIRFEPGRQTAAPALLEGGIGRIGREERERLLARESLLGAPSAEGLARKILPRH